MDNRPLSGWEAEVKNMTKSLGTSNFSHTWKVIKGGYFGTDPIQDRAFKTYMRRGFPEDIRVSPVIGFRCIADAR